MNYETVDHVIQDWRIQKIITSMYNIHKLFIILSITRKMINEYPFLL